MICQSGVGQEIKNVTRWHRTRLLIMSLVTGSHMPAVRVAFGAARVHGLHLWQGTRSVLSWITEMGTRFSSPGSLLQAQRSAGLEESHHCHRASGVPHWVLLPNTPFRGLLAVLALCPSSWEETEGQHQPQTCPHGWALPEKRENKVWPMTKQSSDSEIPIRKHSNILAPLS